MFKSVICVGILLAIISVEASQNEKYIPNATNKDYPGMCYYYDTQTAIPVGTTYRPATECVEMYCRDDYVLHLLYCPRYQVGEGCTTTRNEGAQYPDCCTEVNCP